jgi:hypothetical protein
MDSGKSRLANKVAGIVVSGDSDGAEHIIGNLANFFAALGLTFPPFCSLTLLIALIPFSVSLIDKYDNQVSFIIYSLMQILQV